MAEPRMLYFGPWDRAGHYLVGERGDGVYGARRGNFPWSEGDIDGSLQPWSDGTFGSKHEGGYRRKEEAPQGVALVHHRGGWTALSFWDRSVDSRGACNSNYFAEGDFTFEQMVEMARIRFAYRWNKMGFKVAEFVQRATHCSPSSARTPAEKDEMVDDRNKEKDRDKCFNCGRAAVADSRSGDGFPLCETHYWWAVIAGWNPVKRKASPGCIAEGER
ncbi:MAG TPA: hypothetical protein VM554_13020 [Acidisarcina sp.]|nr:hypothetical protein [Acidisarcina sp.]